MGYAKYHEDDIKISDDRFFLQNDPAISTHTDVSSMQYYDCKYCNRVFDKRSALFYHIKHDHNIVRPLVMINGKIVGDHCIISYLRSAYIDIFGFKCPVEINGRVLPIDESKEIDITNILSIEFKSNRRCLISFQDSDVEVCYVPISCIRNSVVSSIIAQWEADVNTGRRITQPDYDQLSEGSRDFLKGVYNYYIATRSTRDKARRYDDAFALLSGFNKLEGIGKCILKIIAFRRNWISYLEMLTAGDKDIFSIACDYFHRRPSEVTEFSGEKQIYIEDQLMTSLELILLYQKKQFDRLEEKLARIPDLEMLHDELYADRLYLLSARLAVIRNDRRKAESYYERTIAPPFREEYELFRNGLL